MDLPENITWVDVHRLQEEFGGQVSGKNSEGPNRSTARATHHLSQFQTEAEHPHAPTASYMALVKMKELLASKGIMIFPGAPDQEGDGIDES
jgi:hypothetical protein